MKWTLYPDKESSDPAGSAVINHTAGIDALTRKRMFYRHLQERCLARNDCEHTSFFPRVFDLSCTSGQQDFLGDFYFNKATCVLKRSVAGESIPPEGVAAARSVVQRHLVALSPDEVEGQTEADTPSIAPRSVSKSLERDLAGSRSVDFVANAAEVRALDSVRLQGCVQSPQVTSATGAHDAAVADCQTLLTRCAEAMGPQFSLSATATNFWIIKPGELSRSNGIRVFADNLAGIWKYKNGNFVCQKYIERPLLINGRKQDIRQLAFTVDFDQPEGGQCYFEPEVYSYFACKEHNTDGADENAHITGMQVYDCYDTAKYRAWLNEHYGSEAWPHVQAQMRKIVARTLRCVQEDLVMASAKVNSDCQQFQKQRCCEVLGYDFEIDEDLHVWLLEVNEMPSLHYTTPEKDRIVRNFMADCVKVLVSNGRDTGRLELLDEAGESVSATGRPGALGPCPLVPAKGQKLPLLICGRSLLAQGANTNMMQLPRMTSSTPVGIGWSWRHAEQAEQFTRRHQKNAMRDLKVKQRKESAQKSATRKVLRSISLTSLTRSLSVTSSEETAQA